MAGVQVVWTWNETACPLLSGDLYSSKPTYASHLLFLFYTSLLFSVQLVSKSHFKIYFFSPYLLSTVRQQQQSKKCASPSVFEEIPLEEIFFIQMEFFSLFQSHPEKVFPSGPQEQQKWQLNSPNVSGKSLYFMLSRSRQVNETYINICRKKSPILN